MTAFFQLFFHHIFISTFRVVSSLLFFNTFTYQLNVHADNLVGLLTSLSSIVVQKKRVNLSAKYGNVEASL